MTTCKLRHTVYVKYKNNNEQAFKCVHQFKERLVNLVGLVNNVLKLSTHNWQKVHSIFLMC